MIRTAVRLTHSSLARVHPTSQFRLVSHMMHASFIRSSCRPFSSTRQAANQLTSLDAFTEEEEILRDAGDLIRYIYTAQAYHPSSETFFSRHNSTQRPRYGWEGSDGTWHHKGFVRSGGAFQPPAYEPAFDLLPSSWVLKRVLISVAPNLPSPQL